MPPKKSKKDEPCYTKTNKGGGKYVTCEGEQKRNKKLAKEIKTLTADTPKAKAKPKAPVKAKAKAPVKATEKQKELMRKRREAAKAKKVKKVESVDEAYKRHLKEFSQSKYTVSKLKEMIDNIKGRDKDDYRIHQGMENSDKGAVKAINEILKKSDKPKPKIDKDLLQGIMSIMAEVGKEKGKSTQASKDENLALDKKARDGKLTNKDFIDFIYDDEKTFEQMRGFEEDMSETQQYDMNYWYSKVTKKNISSFDDLTDNQQERLQNIMAKDIDTQTKKKMKAFYDGRVKGKKFKSLKELKKLFGEEYNDTTFKH